MSNPNKIISSINNNNNNNNDNSNISIIAIPMANDIILIVTVTMVFHFSNNIACYSSWLTLITAAAIGIVAIIIRYLFLSKFTLCLKYLYFRCNSPSSNNCIKQESNSEVKIISLFQTGTE